MGLIETFVFLFDCRDQHVWFGLSNFEQDPWFTVYIPCKLFLLVVVVVEDEAVEVDMDDVVIVVEDEAVEVDMDEVRGVEPVETVDVGNVLVSPSAGTVYGIRFSNVQ